MIEIFDPFETKFIRNPTILACPNNPIGRTEVVVIPIFQMILACYNNKWQYRLTTKIDILNYNDLFSIVKLYSFSFLIPVVQYHNKDRYNLAYKKACFIEVLDIGFYNIMFGNYILEKSKPNLNNFWIFVLGLLIIVQTIPTYTELWLSFDEIGNPMQSDIYRVVYC